MLRRSVTALVVVLLSFGCSGSESSSSPTGPSGSGSGGNFNLRITDSPFSSARAVLITFSDVSVQRDGNWTKVPFPGGGSTRTCDLKKLENRTEDLLGSASLSAGTYTMVRVTVQSATIYADNPSTSPTPCAASIPAPAGGSTPATVSAREVMLNGSWDAPTSATRTILIDFDGESSLRKPSSSTYALDPVIRIVSIQ
jgi:Domain of unknown function (DUF4382)